MFLRANYTVFKDLHVIIIRILLHNVLAIIIIIPLPVSKVVSFLPVPSWYSQAQARNSPPFSSGAEESCITGHLPAENTVEKKGNG